MFFANDIEEWEQSREYVNRTYSDLQRIIDTLPAAMAVMSMETGELEYANRQFLLLLNCESPEDAGYGDLTELAGQIFALWQGETMSFVYRNSYTDAHKLTIRLHADQIVFKGGMCFVLIGQDVTADAHRARLLSQAAEKEREANQLKSLFLANMSHEIRTPMNAILGLSQTALMREQSPENSAMYRNISSAAKTLLSLINDILDFSKIEAEKLNIVEEVFYLEETISNVFLVASGEVIF